MRVSVWRDDAGYANYHEYLGARITLDGAQVDRVFTADDELGEVIVAAVDSDGQLRIDRAEQKIVTETLRGKVEIHRP